MAFYEQHHFKGEFIMTPEKPKCVIVVAPLDENDKSHPAVRKSETDYSERIDTDETTTSESGATDSTN